MGSAMTAMSFSAFDLGLGVHPHLSLGCLWLEGLRLGLGFRVEGLRCFVAPLLLRSGLKLFAILILMINAPDCG